MCIFLPSNHYKKKNINATFGGTMKFNGPNNLHLSRLLLHKNRGIQTLRRSTLFLSAEKWMESTLRFGWWEIHDNWRSKASGFAICCSSIQFHQKAIPCGGCILSAGYCSPFGANHWKWWPLNRQLARRSAFAIEILITEKKKTSFAVQFNGFAHFINSRKAGIQIGSVNDAHNVQSFSS